jgi:hypothetical protein
MQNGNVETMIEDAMPVPVPVAFFDGIHPFSPSLRENFSSFPIFRRN